MLSEPAKTRHTLLVVGESVNGELFSSESRYAVEKTRTVEAAVARLGSLQPGVVITEMRLVDGHGSDVCKAAKAIQRPCLVLVTTDDPSRVPRALRSGCDSVLLKPFAPNLLFARLGRLARDLESLGARRGFATTAGSNQYCEDMACERCRHIGVTSFDATSFRRSWYACLQCEHVWIAKRQDYRASCGAGFHRRHCDMLTD